MKTLTIILCTVLSTLCTVSANAQQHRSGTKPLLFSNLPATIDFTEAQLGQLFTSVKGQTILLTVADHVTLNGAVASNILKYSNLQTLVIKLPDYKNSFLSISKQMENNSIAYVGRIFNASYADGFELRRNQKGNYQLVKIDTDNTLTDCSLN